jgi:hypothetical protein
LPFVNADEIARAIAGGGPITRDISVEAAALAARRRDEFIANGTSFVAETAFSHPSKVELVRDAKAAGYDIRLHVVVIPVELSVLRVQARVESGGHDVPEDKIRQRHERLWALGALGGTRTPNLLIRSQMLYPIELQAPGTGYPPGAGQRAVNRPCGRPGSPPAGRRTGA